MSNTITNQEALSALLGRRLAIWRRAANMLVLHFGRITRKDDRSWGEFSIHVSCGWRLLKDGAIFAGSHDLYTPTKSSSDFDLDQWLANDYPDNLLEHRMLVALKRTDPVTGSLENGTDHFLVEKVEASGIGDAKLYLSGGYIWECFPACLEGEYWRMLDLRAAEAEHFVASGNRAPSNQSIG